MGEYFLVPKIKRAEGEFSLRGDKSISHRVLFFSALCGKGEKTVIYNLSSADDVMRTLNCLRLLGVDISENGEGSLSVIGHDIYFDVPSRVLFAGNSGTTARIISSILAFQKFPSVLDGDSSLRKRPMRRITNPLRELGLKVWGRENAGKLPLVFEGCIDKKVSGGKKFHLDVASAQVKTALLITNFWTELPVYVKEPQISRDHTETMLPYFSVQVKKDDDGFLYLEGKPKSPGKVRVPGDISSASFLLSLGVLAKGGKIVIKDVLLNPTRLGFVQALENMGAKIRFEVKGRELGENYGDIYAEFSELKSISVCGDMIPKVIDEIPILSVCALFSRGIFSVRDAKELRVKETDRIKAIVENFRKFQVDIEEYEDGFAFEGLGEKAYDLSGDYFISTYGDHRIAMSFFVLGTLIKGNVFLDDIKSVSISYPEFLDDMKKLM